MVARLKEPFVVKWGHLVIATLLLLGAVAANIWVAASYKTTTDGRITHLESSDQETVTFIRTLVSLQRQQSVIIIELKYNTKRYMKQQGVQYEELPDRILLEFMEKTK